MRSNGILEEEVVENPVEKAFIKVEDVDFETLSYGKSSRHRQLKEKLREFISSSETVYSEDELEIAYLCVIMERSLGSRTVTSELLGISTRGLRVRMAKLREKGYLIPPPCYYKDLDKLSERELEEKNTFDKVLSEKNCEPFDLS